MLCAAVELSQLAACVFMESRDEPTDCEAHPHAGLYVGVFAVDSPLLQRLGSAVLLAVRILGLV